jgi:hexulose-6-phosphate isomerase
MHAIGITQCCMWDSTLADFLPAASRAGFEAVELMLRREGDLTPATGAEDARAIARRAGELNLKIFSLALMNLGGTPLDRGAARQAAVEDIRAGLRAAKQLGAGSVLLTLGRLRPDLFYDEAYANGVTSLREAARTADELGIDIAVEFVWNGFLFSPMEMKRFLDDIDHRRVGFYFDPGNMAVFQYPQHWVRILGGHTKLVHVKDWKSGALSGQWTGLLEGEVNFPEVMKELRAIGYHGPLTSEVDPKLAPLEKTVQAIREIAKMT